MASNGRTIARLASDAGVGIDTIRYYQRRGILATPAARGGWRTYDDEALWRVRYVKDAQALGFRLTEIIELLRDAEKSANFCATIRAKAAVKLEEVDRQIAELEARKQQLSTFITTCRAKPDHERCPIARRLGHARTMGDQS